MYIYICWQFFSTIPDIMIDLNRVTTQIFRPRGFD